MVAQITKNIPMPKGVSGIGERKYPWKRMEIGDSFPMEVEIKAARSTASRQGKADGRAYRVRRVPETGEIRCWRVDPKNPGG